MALENEEVCRFCLKGLANDNFEIIENLKLGMLDVLLLKLNFSVSIAPLICINCVESLKKAFYFKTACLSVEQRINHYISATGKRKVDLKEVYLTQKDTKKGRKGIREGQKVCRFCLRLFKNCVLNDIGTDVALTGVLQKYFPELDLSVTKEICACGNCLDDLTNNFNFIMHCLDTENHIKKYYEMEGISGDMQVSLRLVSHFVAILKSIDPDSDDYNADVETDQTQDANQNQNWVDNDVLREDFETFGAGEGLDETYADYEGRSHAPAAKLPRSRKGKASPSTKNRASKTNRTKAGVLNVQRPARSASPAHKCAQCAFQTKYKSTYDKHQLQHKPAAELTMYKCEDCSFETKHKGSHTRHVLMVHNSQKRLYECQQCPFKTHSKRSFNLHGNNHRDDFAAPTYPCAKCPHKAPSRAEAKKHEASHARKVYSCRSCDFKTEDRLALREHKVAQGHIKVAGFKCDVCDFVTKHKGNLKIHSLTHKSSSETIMYKCSQCPFETKHKVSLKTHMLRHKSLSEVECHECEVCGFKAKHKGNLKLHMVIHKDPTETVMYKCERCDFQTKHKMSLRTHMLRHKKRSEVALYRCDVCEFETLHKGNLKKHELIHKDASEVTCYRCRLCSFETIHKGSFKTHATSFHPQLDEGEAVAEETV